MYVYIYISICVYNIYIYYIRMYIRLHMTSELCIYILYICVYVHSPMFDGHRLEPKKHGSSCFSTKK